MMILPQPLKNHKNGFRFRAAAFCHKVFKPSLQNYQNPVPALPLVIQLTIVGASASVIMGYNLAVLNTAMPMITADFGWCRPSNDPQIFPNIGIGWDMLECDAAKSKQGLISSSLILGAAIGSLLAGHVMSGIGRRLTLVLIHLGFIVSGILAAFSDAFSSLLIARLVTGVFCGTATVAPAVYLIEIAAPHQRELYSLVPTISGNLGVLLGILAGLPFKYPTDNELLSSVDWARNVLWWRRMVVIPLLVAGPAVLCLLKLYPFDTPKYMRLSGNSHKSIESILWPHQQQSPSMMRDSETAHDSEAKNSPTSHAPAIPLFQALRFAALRWRLLIGFILAAAQQFSGMAVFVAFSNILFSEAGVPGDQLSMASAAMAMLQLLSSVVSGFHLKHWPRKQFMGGGSLLMGLCLMPAVIAGLQFQGPTLQYCSIFSTLAFTTIYGLTVGPGLLIYMDELFPAQVKDIGLSIAFTFNWLASFAVISISAMLTQLQSFILFTGVCLGTAIFICIFCPETRQTATEGSAHHHTDIEFSIVPNLNNSDKLSDTET